ncbi:MAG: Flp pilus assembly complex ATPase component TadA [Candidatus Omnitrophica bacterium]|nr:Flp pilus assembly complex ATPase component TadA [Candidatus Omnitrophota bacterium]
MVKKKKRLNDLLLDYHLIDDRDLARAIDLQQRRGGQLATIFIEEGLVKEEEIAACFCRYLHIPMLTLTKLKTPEETVKIIPEHVARHYRILTISHLGNMLTVAMNDPLNVLAIDDVKALTGYDLIPVVATLSDISKAIDRFYHHITEEKGDQQTLDSLVKEVNDEEIQFVKAQEQVDIGDVIRSSEEAPIVRMIDALIAEALIKRASDIHIEPYEARIRVRFRVDGALREAAVLPKKVQNAVSARLKIMSNLDITQRHIPQDGRFKVKLEGKEVDFRVSVLPISHGEKVVMRALDKSNLSVGLETLGFLPQAMQVFGEAVTRPYGMVLVTGPTGSGKSTTLYSVLNKLNTPQRNVITVEDPVEYQVEGITQVQVKSDIGMTFAIALRAILRQNPDILMVGEIRDFETGDIAVKAALTGALLLSTLHTNDAPGAVTRLIDMGIEPFLIASSVICVGAQRLARKICEQCKEAYQIPQSVLDRLGVTVDAETFSAYRGKGCPKCNKTGYKGRFAILEAMAVTDEVQGMIIRRCSSDEIKRFARAEQGMLTLRDTGIQNFLQGKTTLEEVLRVTSSE